MGDDEVAELRTEALVLACSFHPELFLKVFVPLTRQQHSRPSLTVAIIKPYCNPIIYSTSNLFWTLNFEIISNVSRTLPLPKTKPSRLVYYQFQLALDPPPSVASEDKDSDPSITKKTRKGWLPEEGVAKWATNKAVNTWAGFGKEKSGWKVCICSVYWLKHDDGWVLGF